MINIVYELMCGLNRKNMLCNTQLLFNTVICITKKFSFHFVLFIYRFLSQKAL